MIAVAPTSSSIQPRVLKLDLEIQPAVALPFILLAHQSEPTNPFDFPELFIC